MAPWHMWMKNDLGQLVGPRFKTNQRKSVYKQKPVPICSKNSSQSSTASMMSFRAVSFPPRTGDGIDGKISVKASGPVHQGSLNVVWQVSSSFDVFWTISCPNSEMWTLVPHQSNIVQPSAFNIHVIRLARFYRAILGCLPETHPEWLQVFARNVSALSATVESLSPTPQNGTQAFNGNRRIFTSNKVPKLKTKLEKWSKSWTEPLPSPFLQILCLKHGPVLNVCRQLPGCLLHSSQQCILRLKFKKIGWMLWDSMCLMVSEYFLTISQIKRLLVLFPSNLLKQLYNQNTITTDKNKWQMTRVFACFTSAAVFTGFQDAFSPWKESIPKQPPPKSSKRYCQPWGTNILTWGKVLRCHCASVILTLPNSMALPIFVTRAFKLRRFVWRSLWEFWELLGLSGHQPFALRHFVNLSDHVGPCRIALWLVGAVLGLWLSSRHRVTGWKASQQHWHPGCMPR